MPLTQKHFRSGSEFPKPETDKLRFYSMQFCPYAQRTQLLLLAKGIPFETVNIHLKQKPEWYLEKINPLGKVPSVQHGDKIVYDSAIINDYIDCTYPGEKFTPADAYQQAQHRMLLELWNRVVGPFYKLFGSMGADTEGRTNLFRELDYFEKELETKGTPFFGGDKCMMVDLMIWPHAIRIWLLGEFIPELVLDKARYPKLTSWKEKMMSLPAIQQSPLTAEVFKAFIVSIKNGDPDYDIGIEE